MRQLLIKDIWIYPIKSLSGVQVKSGWIREKGLDLDRRWMLIDENGVFLTQRKVHSLAKFKIKLDEDGIEVNFNENTFSFDANKFEIEPVHAIIWNSQVSVNEVNREGSLWFSEMLNMRVRLVHFPEKNIRTIENPYQYLNVSLADSYPLLIIGQSSLDDLNSRMAEPVPMNRFRPNIVFTGGEPYEEDSWQNFTIGKGKLRGARRSFRCIVTTIDQETGIKGREPLLTLSKYRREKEKIFFGLNTLPLNSFFVKEGDAIEINSL